MLQRHATQLFSNKIHLDNSTKWKIGLFMQIACVHVFDRASWRCAICILHMHERHAFWKRNAFYNELNVVLAIVLSALNQQGLAKPYLLSCMFYDLKHENIENFTSSHLSLRAVILLSEQQWTVDCQKSLNN